MAIARFGSQAKRSYGLCVKMTAVTVLGLCFVFIWSMFSSSSSVVSQRSTFGDITESVSANGKLTGSAIVSEKKEPRKDLGNKDNKKANFESDLEEKGGNKVNGSLSYMPADAHKRGKGGSVKKEGTKVKSPKKDEKKKPGLVRSEGEELQKDQEGEQEEEVEENETEEKAADGEEGTGNEDLEEDAESLATDDVDLEPVEKVDDEGGRLTGTGKKRKIKGPLFDPKTHYTWKLCSTRSKHNYIPCIDIESASGRLQSYRHHERSCPRTSPMCLVPLPPEGYATPFSWPESKSKIFYKNVAHPKLAAFIKMHNWVVKSGEYLTFPQNQSEFKGGTLHYLESIEEMVPDIEWGKNIRIVLEIGCTDSSFAAALLDKDVLTLTLGLKDDLVDLAQVALERGFPAVVSPFRSRRIPFPSGVFDAIHCGECQTQWHSNGGKLLLEMNRILRPGGYFILSNKHDSIEIEEAMSTLTASICWNILAHKTDEISEAGVKIYQKPESNDIYKLRRKKDPPLCKENENPDASW